MNFLDDKALLRELLAERHLNRTFKTYLNAPTDHHEKMLRLEQLGITTRVDHQDSPSSINWKVHYDKAQQLYEMIVQNSEQPQPVTEQLQLSNEPYELFKKYGGDLGGNHAQSIMRQMELFAAIGPVAGTSHEILTKLHKVMNRLEAIEKSINTLHDNLLRGEPQ